MVPSPLVAGCGSLLELAFTNVWLRDTEHTAATTVLLLTTASGWFGLVMPWRLYYGVLRGRCDTHRRLA